MITLSNGYSFEFMAASGTLAFDGRGWPWEQPLRWMGTIKPELFTIVVKSLTLKPRQGNLRWYAPWRCVRLLKEGTVNAVGLTNPGIDEWIKNIYPKIEESPWNFVVSIAGENLQEYMEMTLRLKNCAKLKALEINASCPNSSGELQQNAQAVIDTAQALKYVTTCPLILKLSYTHDYVKIAKALENVVEAISINSVPWSAAYPNKKSPLQKLGNGGVSGKMVQKYTWKMVEELSRSTTIPVIGASVWEYEDLAKLFELGAKAIAFGSLFLRYPWRPTAFVRRWQKQSQKN
ncbi:MAG: hypothetical protein A3H42_05650 [Deltaproteobacteria bacterium RIFCSPLOWO2_02_FULL_46_8]|nr:MAG: hypothetical protein A3H42_05650 [Deltaproteobacteria bacterium RIFCSPLOWO2_02_FULL_46_8]